MAGPWDKYAAPQSSGPWQKYDQPQGGGVMGQVAGFMANVNRGLGIGDEIAGGIAGLPGAASALGRADFRGVGQAFGDAMANQRATEDTYAANHPHMAALGRGTGMAATVAVPAGAAVQGGRAMNMARGAVGAATQATAFSALDRGSAAERLQAASDTTHNPLVLALGAGAGALARTAPRAARPQNTAAARLTQQGVPTTAGQRAGGLGRRLEDAAESLPMTGAAIKARKTEGLRGLGQAAINEALAPINARVNVAGRQGMEAANQHLSDFYNDAVQGVQVLPDAQYQADLAAIVGDPRLPAGTRQGVQDIIQEHIDLLPSDPTGAMWKEIDSEIGAAFRAADNASGTTPGARSLRRALGRVREAHDGLMMRQNPQAAQRLQAADAANAAMERVRAAAAGVGTAAREGLFTGADLNRAVATKGGRSGRRAYGQGTALMQGLSDDAQAVLPSTVPDSGTALRSFIAKLGAGGGALAGLGTVAGSGPAVGAAVGGLGLDSLGALLYSRPVQDALRASARARQTGAQAGLLAAPVAARAARAGGLLATPQTAPRR